MEELRKADEEIDEGFHLTSEDIKRSRDLDKTAKHEKLDNRSKKIAAQKAAYREANKEKYRAYTREYMRKRRAAAKQASAAV